jgi:putative ABC transport system permease protein
MRISPSENLAVAVNSVWTHKFRSLLTILGIVIGITTVVTVSSLLTGLQKGIITFFEEFGPDNIFVNRYSGDPLAPPQRNQIKRKPLDPAYTGLIKKLAPSVEETSASLFFPGILGRQLITARVPGFETENVNLVGVSASNFVIQPRVLREGRVFTPEEDARAARVCVIGPLVAEALFPAGGAVGQNITVGGAEYTVLGVADAAKGGFFGENSIDRQIVIPLQTARQRYPQADRFIIVAKAREGKRDDAFEEVRNVLRRIRRTPHGAEDDFSITTPQQIVEQFQKITGMVVLVSIGLSALGLLVGGIGVMNIMLVSVTERTREIGIRKAIGARRFDITFQFLMEAVTLTGFGGVLGIIVSLLVTLLVGTLVPSLPSQVPLWAVLTGFGVSVGVGLFFGVWPAFKAAQLDPVEALRYE